MRPKKSILLVESNEELRGTRQFLLETRGYRVESCADARTGLEMIQCALPNAYDLLLCDLLLPGMDGNELVRRVKYYRPALPALIYSNTVASFDRAIAADAFLPKGAGSSAELLERVRLLCARKRGPRKAVPVIPYEYVPVGLGDEVTA